MGFFGSLSNGLFNNPSARDFDRNPRVEVEAERQAALIKGSRERREFDAQVQARAQTLSDSRFKRFTEKIPGRKPRAQREEEAKVFKQSARKQRLENVRARGRASQRKRRGFGVGSQLKSIQRVQQQEQQIAQPQPEFTTAQQVRQSRQPQGITNFFEHRSTGEVFGDEGLTLFDSNKPNRTQRRTGSFFGV